MAAAAMEAEAGRLPELPRALWVRILLLTADVDSILSAGAVCRDWRETGADEDLWRGVAQAIYPPHTLIVAAYCSYKRLVLHRNARNAVPCLDLRPRPPRHPQPPLPAPLVASVWRCNDSTRFYQCAVLGMELQASHTEAGPPYLRLAFDAAGESDLRHPATSSLAVVVPAGRRESADAAREGVAGGAGTPYGGGSGGGGNADDDDEEEEPAGWAGSGSEPDAEGADEPGHGAGEQLDAMLRDEAWGDAGEGRGAAGGRRGRSPASFFARLLLASRGRYGGGPGGGGRGDGRGGAGGAGGGAAAGRGGGSGDGVPWPRAPATVVLPRAPGAVSGLRVFSEIREAALPTAICLAQAGPGRYKGCLEWSGAPLARLLQCLAARGGSLVFVYANDLRHTPAREAYDTMWKPDYAPALLLDAATPRPGQQQRAFPHVWRRQASHLAPGELLEWLRREPEASQQRRWAHAPEATRARMRHMWWAPPPPPPPLPLERQRQRQQNPELERQAVLLRARGGMEGMVLNRWAPLNNN